MLPRKKNNKKVVSQHHEVGDFYKTGQPYPKSKKHLAMRGEKKNG